MTEAEQERARVLIPTQADREAAASFFDGQSAAAFKNGELDRNQLPQALAAHRNAALEEAAAEADKRGHVTTAAAIRALKAPERGEHRKDGR